MRFLLATAVRSRRDAIGVSALVALVIVQRGPTWFAPLADPTIGLYLHIGRAFAHGTLPYETAWDFRPPGLFALYALGFAIARTQAANVLATVALAATALALRSLGRSLDPRRESRTGWIAATGFVLLSSVDDALAGAADVEIAAFVAWAIAVALRSRSRPRIAAVAGLLAGCAIQCKLSALPLALVPLGIVAERASVRAIGAFAAAALAPIALETIAYVRAGALTLLVQANAWALVHRATIGSGTEFDRNRPMMLRQAFALAPAIEFAPVALARADRSLWFAAAGWWVAAAFSIALTGEFFERQFVALVAPTALLGALGLVAALRALRVPASARTIALAVLALATFGLHGASGAAQGAAFAVHRIALGDATWNADRTSRVRAAIRCATDDDPSLFVLPLSPYLYDLTGAPAPTRYPYGDHLLDPILSHVAGIDGRAELARIFALRPRTVVIGTLDDYRYAPARVAFVRRILARDYRAAVRARDFTLYRLLGAPASLRRCGE